MLRHSIARVVYALARDRAPKLRGRKRAGHALARMLVTNEPLVVTSYGLTFGIDLRDHVEEQIFWEDYDRSIVTWWQSQIAPNAIVLDIGANVGLYSLIAARQGANVIAFEPNPRTRERLEANIRRNAVGARIKVREDAVSDRVGSATLYADVNEDASVSNSGVASLSNANAGGRAMRVATTTLDTVVAEEQLTRIDWMKLDIQGAEFSALRAAAGALAMRPRILLEMEHVSAKNMGWTEHDLRELLAAHGYRLEWIDSLNVIAEPR